MNTLEKVFTTVAQSAVVAMLLALAAAPIPCQAGEASEMLLDFEDFDLAWIEKAGEVDFDLVEGDSGKALQVTTTDRDARPGIILNAPGGFWDFSEYLYLVMDVTNLGEHAAEVNCRINERQWRDSSAVIQPGDTRPLTVLLKRNARPEHLSELFPRTFSIPGGYVWTFEPFVHERISRVLISLPEPPGHQKIRIDNVRLEGDYHVPTLEEMTTEIMPFVDRYGQYKHLDWPGKVHSDEDLAQFRAEEAEDLAAHPGPEPWDQYGGWAGGPQLEATGHFRTEKLNGKWWLVDPEGHLFWSHGVTCVHPNNGSTSLTGREGFYEDLPEQDDPEYQFMSVSEGRARGGMRGGEAVRGQAAGDDDAPREQAEVDDHRGAVGRGAGTRSFGGARASFNFTAVNLFRKYGEAWESAFQDLCHRRLRSWGMNTLGAWSGAEICAQQRTAYTIELGSGGQRVGQSRLPDPFAPGWGQAMQEQMARRVADSADDPWCIGYFVDNELSWGQTGTRLVPSIVTIESRADTPAKIAFMEDLKEKYETVEILNAVWDSDFASWDDFLETTTHPDKNRAWADLAAFDFKFADLYYKTCNEALKAAAPNKLYLGSRMDFHNYPEEQYNMDWCVKAAGRHCDVISFNRYRFSAKTLWPPFDVDKPVMIGEWNFGATDRGHLYTGMRNVSNQEQRGEMYAAYVRGALENPFCVGTHWFQFHDMCITGRGDGANGNVGMLDIVDTPHEETIAGVRDVGYNLYEIRSNGMFD